MPWCYRFPSLGAVAQLVARLVRNEKVRGSNPLSSTNPLVRGHIWIRIQKHEVATQQKLSKVGSSPGMLGSSGPASDGLEALARADNQGGEGVRAESPDRGDEKAEASHGERAERR